MSEAYSEANHEKWKKIAEEQISALVDATRHQPLPWDAGWTRVDEAIMRALRTLKDKQGCPEALMYLENAMEAYRGGVVGSHDATVSCKDPVVQLLFERIGETAMVSFLWKAHKDDRNPFEELGGCPDKVLPLEEKLGIPHDARHAEKTERLLRALRERRLTR